MGICLGSLIEVVHVDEGKKKGSKEGIQVKVKGKEKGKVGKMRKGRRREERGERRETVMKENQLEAEAKAADSAVSTTLL